MNIFAYRLPAESNPIFYESSQVLKLDVLPDDKGFVFAPFEWDGKFRFIKAEKRLCGISETQIKDNDQIFQASFTNKNDYFQYIERIKNVIGNRRDSKIVASRRITIDRPIDLDINLLFKQLCHEYPNSYIFLFSTPEYGTWLGASPELMLKSNNKVIETVSLAGTRPSGSKDKWDIKNITEQQIVTHYIISVLRENGFCPTQKETHTATAGPVEHLKTEIYSMNPGIELSRLIKNLYPTPALAGFPKDEAIRIIKENEYGGRSLYGGFSGPISSNKDFSLFVTLRCMQISSKYLTLMAGGGITMDSIPIQEWEETENKLKTLMKFVK